MTGVIRVDLHIHRLTSTFTLERAAASHSLVASAQRER